MFKYRYIMGIILFVFMVAMGYSTSSMGQYNYVVQPHHTQKYDLPVWGVIRGIRSDEFIASTPTLLSQELEGSFDETNDKLVAKLVI